VELEDGGRGKGKKKGTLRKGGEKRKKKPENKMHWSYVFMPLHKKEEDTNKTEEIEIDSGDKVIKERNGPPRHWEEWVVYE